MNLPSSIRLRLPWLPLLLLLPLLLIAGCSSLTTHREKGLREFQHVYVEHLLTDNYRLDEAIAAELKRLGYDASYGPLTMMPDNTEVIVSYQARTEWDFKSYLIEFNVQAKANFTGKSLGSGRYHQASVRTKSPDEVVHTVIAALFPRR